MDMNIFHNSIFNCLFIFLPLFYAVYLLISRVKLNYVPKKILNNGFSIISFFTVIFFGTQQFLFSNSSEAIKEKFTFFSSERFSLDFGFMLDSNNIKLLLYASITYLLLGIFSSIYFKKKKQFIFTKQRFYSFISFLAFNTYAFLTSLNLFQCYFFWVLNGILIFVFSYFDIFKNPTNYNITRFQRITLIGDFSFLCAILILFKYALLSQDHISSLSLNFDELNLLVSYMYGISNLWEFHLMIICFTITILSRFFIFPLNCYYSFLANSSNIFYLSICTCANSIFSALIFFKFVPLFKLTENYAMYLENYIIVCAIISAFLIFFEKNIKIIFGHILAIINSIFILTYFKINESLSFYIYCAANLIILLILMILFMKDKVSLERSFINKQKGFLIEKLHIFIFENLPIKISKFFNLLDEKIVQNISLIFIHIFNYLMTLFVFKTAKGHLFKNIKNILIIIALFTLFAIFIALFGRLN